METARSEVRQISIAIVDDEEDLVDIYLKMFARRKYLVSFVANNGYEAIRKFTGASPRPRIVLMDHRLPGLSGVEVTREMLKIDPRARIIFLSADYDIKNDALRAGAVGFVKKPASIREILNAIDAALDNNRE